MRILMLLLAVLLPGGLFFLVPAATDAENGADTAAADVVVVVDTSKSMRRPGMDPERTSLLVTRLLADIVPGELAVVRLLDLGDDRDVLPSRRTGKMISCAEEGTPVPCWEVERLTDWSADARRNKPGTLTRPARGEPGYKQTLEKHLAQRSNNSLFDLAFRAAQGIFDEHQQRAQHLPRTILWLSDGSSDDTDSLREVITQLKAEEVATEAIVFDQGDPHLAQALGLKVTRVKTPAEIMKAFANAFRRIVQAPYRIDNQVAGTPDFEMKPNIQEAWIVVYGDDTLGDARISGPGITVKADYAADRWPGAGAYRVAYLRQPPTGRWTVHASGGGAGVAYAVVQRSDLTPVLLEPATALAGTETTLVVGIRAGLSGDWLTDPELLRDTTVSITIQDQKVTLNDAGSGGDTKADDGHYTARMTFPEAGRIPVRIYLRSTLVERSVETSVDVTGKFRYTGGPVELDLGTLGVAGESCRSLRFEAEQQGKVPFTLQVLRKLPAGHSLELRSPTGTLLPAGPTLTVLPGEPLQICLKTAARVGSSSAAGEPWLTLQAAGSQAPQQQLTIHLRWQVMGLSFWQLWGWLILWLLAILLMIMIILGFVLPQRFRDTLAIVFVPDRQELDEQSPQPVKLWKGVGSGFYRNAKAFLHADFRLSGKAKGALASLHAERGGTRVMPSYHTSLFRETLDGDWENVPPPGQRVRAGDVYRIGDRGPYFRIAVRG